MPKESKATATKKRLKPLKLFFTCLVLGLAVILFINVFVKLAASPRLISAEEAAEIQDIDCILVLGCGVWQGGIPTPMLSDRLETGVNLYQAGASGKLLMSGDHGTIYYDEVSVMKNYAVEKGVPSSDVFMDHAGFSTYESLYRAKEIFLARKIIIVTQKYHLHRALYIARGLGLDAFGVSSDQRIYAGQHRRDAREILARVKDFFITIFKPKPRLLGDIIPISGDGDLTNDY